MSERPPCHWIRFEPIFVSSRHKTHTISVESEFKEETLGTIKWHGAWRQYAFFPEEGTVWSPECLEAVASYIEALMGERRVGAA